VTLDNLKNDNAGSAVCLSGLQRLNYHQKTLPDIVLLFLLYGLFGQHIPGEFGHPGVPLNSFLGTLVITEGGLWGKLTGVSVSVVAVFVIFGAVLNAGEAGQGFMNVAIAAAGRLKGGAAKVSVIKRCAQSPAFELACTFSVFATAPVTGAVRVKAPSAATIRAFLNMISPPIVQFSRSFDRVIKPMVDQHTG
jgi:TRAP-type uncharacterized transport system fused permease subunit